MPPKNFLTISDIEDEEDIQERNARRKAGKTCKSHHAPKKQRVSLSYLDDDLDPPVMLSKKLRHVENKMSNMTDSSPVDPKAVDLRPGSSGILTSPHQEDAPMVVESEELKAEFSVDSIPSVDKISHVLVRTYESLQLHHLFSTVEENCKFRLFLYAVAFGHTAFWPKDPVMVSVLKRVLTSQEVHLELKKAGVRTTGFSQTIEKLNRVQEPEKDVSVEETLSNTKTRVYPIMRYSEAIEVPKKIMRLLPGA
ncbi:hypothetical protein JCM33374_g395 [Metschnikowia sp. JCM 33374]|nr:hypothetical protein JCM33374_g395 [Metschnikowia sp. JCM 33374]